MKFNSNNYPLFLPSNIIIAISETFSKEDTFILESLMKAQPGLYTDSSQSINQRLVCENSIEAGEKSALDDQLKITKEEN